MKKRTKDTGVDYRDRFGLSHHPFSKDFLRQNHVETDGTKRLKERFHWLQSERGIGLLTGPSGVGKTATLGAIAEELPKHQRRVLYVEDSGAGTGDLFRYVAYELGLVPAFRRATLWRELKAHILKLEDESDQQVILVIDDAHRLPFAFLNSLGGFLNFAFDSRELLTVWLVGDSSLTRVLNMAAHQHLKTRLRLTVQLEPFSRDELNDYVEACFAAAGCTRQVVSDTAMDAVFHLSHGIPRTAGKILGLGLRIAHDNGKDIICDQVVEAVRQEVLL